ncbi:MAG: type II toxin-antitoxin system PemK/MazF family toxin, partial [Oscillospiraceae bacterium]|nr:type II toxin-antitoxin system PemK/MazF family toxin [Oscillospiraceae bacterium]
LQGASCGLFRDSTVLLEQLRTLDKSRLDEYMGSVGEDKMREVDAALNVSVGLAEIYR